MRRHPVASPGAAKRGARPPSIRTGAPRRPQAGGEKRSLRNLLRPRFAEEIISELRKVTWPTREETLNLTIVVVIVAGAFGIFLGGVDMFFNWMIDNTLLRPAP